MRLFTLIFICFQVAGIAVSSGKSCVYQVKTRTVQSGGSVIIPCSYSDPQELGGEEQISIRWTEGNETTCQFARGVISPEKVAEKYDGRLFTWKDTNKTRTHYMEITGLKTTDGPLFCCQIFNKQDPQNDWESQHGTLLQFSDKKTVTQLDELIAVLGEDIEIPCHYPRESIDSVREVTWYHVASNWKICDTNAEKVYISNNPHQDNRHSLVNYPQGISLRIRKTKKQDQGGYCCEVAATRILSKQITTLLVADQLINITNSAKIIVQKGGSVNLTCSYTQASSYKERDVVRVNVYWRVGNVTGPYAYHPYREMVHSRYIQRTTITGTANLQINGVKTEDNTTFHCFVVFKLCKGDNQYEDSIVYGGETRLNVEDANWQDRSYVSNQGTHSIKGDIPIQETSPTEKTPKELPISIISIIITSVIIMIVIILILLVLKVKGVLCKKKGNISEHQMNTIQDPAKGDRSSKETGYSETSSKKPGEVPVVGADNLGGTVEDGADDKLLYAKLDETKLNDKSRARPKHSEEVVYADVVNTAHK
ncbi:uncharacterized protein [Aquarana catesbeiana]|uniref:uncharacterized protein isoform X1 n=1 Tax=Aquarana catesbeiana TaxID=8400 RepID=UPI003CCA5139